MRALAAALTFVSVVLGAAQAAGQDLDPSEAPPPLPPSVYVVAPPEEEPEIKPIKFSFKLDGGFWYRRLYSSDLAGGEIELAVGGRKGESAGSRRNSMYATLHAALGGTSEGLSARRYGLGFLYERTMGRLRFGAGFNFTLLDISRETTRSTMWALGITPRVGASVDLYRTPADHALYLGLRTGVDVYFLNVEHNRRAPIAPGMTLGLGYRF